LFNNYSSEARLAEDFWNELRDFEKQTKESELINNYIKTLYEKEYFK